MSTCINIQTELSATIEKEFVQMEKFCLILKERLERTLKVHGSIGSVLVSQKYN